MSNRYVLMGAIAAAMAVGGCAAESRDQSPAPRSPAAAAPAAPAAAPAPSAAAAPAPASPAQTAMRQMGGASRAINEELKKEAPDAAVLKASAQRLNTLAGDLPRWFAAPVAPDSGFKTAAKPEIWSDAAGFAQAAAAFKAQTAKLAELSGGSDLAAFKAQAAVIPGACNACHSKYRAAEKK